MHGAASRDSPPARPDSAAFRATIPPMLITVILIYVAVWACAYASVHRFPGRAGFWGLYALSVFVLPGVFSGLFHLIYARVDAENAAGLTATVLLLGTGLALLVFPISRARLRRDRK